MSDVTPASVRDTIIDSIPDLLAYHFRVDIIPTLSSNVIDIGLIALKGLAASASGIYIDMRFKEVSGLGYTFQSTDGADGTPFNRASSIKYNELTLKRGLLIGGSLLGYTFAKKLQDMKLQPQRMVISLLSSLGLPASSWLLEGVEPSGWQLDALNAETNSLAIESMTFSYTKLRRLTIG
ncbi:MAG: phage tail protein [Alteromonadaceae bacterium]|nr:phage tail protein [Alteromonadaceae bacterium]